MPQVPQVPQVRVCPDGSVLAVRWPVGAANFTIYPESGKQRGEGNGVLPIKISFVKSLVDAGWITREVGTGGRGGKSGRISATKKLLAVDLEFIPPDEGWGIPPELRPCV